MKGHPTPIQIQPPLTLGARPLGADAVAAMSDFVVMAAEDDGLLLVQSPDHPRLEAEARLLGGLPVPRQAWVFPGEARPRIVEIYRELFFPSTVGGGEPRFPVRLHREGKGGSGDAEPSAEVCRLPASEILARLDVGEPVEVLAGREELARWAHDELLARLDDADRIDRGLRGLLSSGPDGRPHPDLPRWVPYDEEDFDDDV